MRYTLSGELQSCYGHDNSKTHRFEEVFNAEKLDIAIVIARAMLQSRKIRNEMASNPVERLSAVLKDSRDWAVWSSNLILERRETKVITPEHFEEKLEPSRDDDDEFSRFEQSA